MTRPAARLNFTAHRPAALISAHVADWRGFPVFAHARLATIYLMVK
jgi:hypothetical protein